METGKAGNLNRLSECESSAIPWVQSECQFFPRKNHIKKSGKFFLGQGKVREDEIRKKSGHSVIR